MNYKAIAAAVNKLPKDSVVLELGAMDGSFTSQIKSWVKNGTDRYYMFEPNPNNKDMCLDNKPDNVKFIDQAIWHTTGKAKFWVSKSTSSRPYNGQSSLREPEPRGEYSFTEVEVNTITLDDFCKQEKIDEIGFIWCDIQGAEGDMIAGGKIMIPKTKLMLLEVMKKEAYLNQLLENEIVEYALLNGFEILEKMECDILFKNKKWKI